jgi:hypothetical protein
MFLLFEFMLFALLAFMPFLLFEFMVFMLFEFMLFLLAEFMLLAFMLLALPPLIVPPVLLFDIEPLLLVLMELVLELVVVVVEFIVEVFALPVLALSVAQPVQKAATASKAKRAKVLRIEFFSCNPVGQSVKSCAELKRYGCQPPRQLGQCLRLQHRSQTSPCGGTERMQLRHVKNHQCA